MKLNADKIFPPLVQFGMLKRYRLQTVSAHQGMWFAFRAVGVKFFFQKMVNRRVEIEGEAGRLTNAESTVQVKTARALEKKFQLASAQPERFLRLRVKQIPAPLASIVFGHLNGWFDGQAGEIADGHKIPQINFHHLHINHPSLFIVIHDHIVLDIGINAPRLTKAEGEDFFFWIVINFRRHNYLKILGNF